MHNLMGLIQNTFFFSRSKCFCFSSISNNFWERLKITQRLEDDWIQMLEGKCNYFLNNTQQLYKGNDLNTAINLLQKVKELNGQQIPFTGSLLLHNIYWLLCVLGTRLCGSIWSKKTSLGFTIYGSKQFTLCIAFSVSCLLLLLP